MTTSLDTNTSSQTLARAAVPVTTDRAVYTVLEAAHLLSLSRGSAYAMVRSGQIPAKRIGTRWVIPRARFEAWLNELPEASVHGDTDWSGA
ncbi:MAG: helix-turn-helix domain-containing protein [Actinomycetota bacterium]